MNEAGVIIAGRRSQLLQHEAAIRQLHDQVNTIPEVEAEYAKLTRDYGQYRSLYSELLLRKERERLGTVGEDQNVVSFNIIDPPAASIDPVAPKRQLLLIVVLVAGLCVGAGLAFLVHKVHPVFHDAKTLRALTGRPVLGVVSMTWLERHKLGRTVDFSSFAVAGASLMALFVIAFLLQEQFTSQVHALLSQASG